MKSLQYLLCLAIILSSFKSHSQDGPAIFKKNCAICHTIGNGKLVGPDLKGVDKKHDIKWLLQWVKSSQTMITKKKDAAAIKLFDENNHMVMPDQALTDEEIKIIAAYIGEETARLEQPAPAAEVAAAPAAAVSPATTPAPATAGLSAQTINYILTGIIAFLTLVLIGLAKTIKDLAEAQKEEFRN